MSKGTALRALRVDDELWNKVARRAHNEATNCTQIARDAWSDYLKSVELWENNAGGLYLVANNTGYALRDGANPGEFAHDAQGWNDGLWNPDDELDTVDDWITHLEDEADAAPSDRTQCIATWTPLGVTLHRRGGGASSDYIGIEYI